MTSNTPFTLLISFHSKATKDELAELLSEKVIVMDMKAEILKRVKLKVPNVIPENILVDIEDTILMVALE